MFSSIEYNIYYKGHINYRIQSIESHRNKKNMSKKFTGYVKLAITQQSNLIQILPASYNSELFNTAIILPY